MPDDDPAVTWCSGTAIPHEDGVILFLANIPSCQCTLGTPTAPIQIYGNDFYEDSTSGAQTAYIFPTAFGGTLYIYNNIFINSQPSGGGEGPINLQDRNPLSRNDPPSWDYHVLNNTFFNNEGGITAASYSSGYEFDLYSNYVLDARNNVFYSTAVNPQMVLMRTNNADGLNHAKFTTLDYNQYFVLGKTQSNANLLELWTNSRELSKKPIRRWLRHRPMDGRRTGSTATHYL